MTKSRRVNRFLVCCPKDSKNLQTRYFDFYDVALDHAKELNEKNGNDVLILKVVAVVEPFKIKMSECVMFQNEERIETIVR